MSFKPFNCPHSTGTISHATKTIPQSIYHLNHSTCHLKLSILCLNYSTRHTNHFYSSLKPFPNLLEPVNTPNKQFHIPFKTILICHSNLFTRKTNHTNLLHATETIPHANQIPLKTPLKFFHTPHKPFHITNFSTPTR